MAKMNRKPDAIYTHEGAKAKRVNAEQLLRRSVCSCLLWERGFYEDGESIADRIKELCREVDPATVASIAVEARERFKLRHVPLLMVRELARMGCPTTGETLTKVIQRADEPAEFLSIYWKDGKQPLSAQVKKGLAAAFRKFSAYQLAKYNRDGAVKMRDALFLCHAKPKDDEQAANWKALVDGSLPAPDTWEVELSSGKDKKETWTRLVMEKKLGGLALLRNLRNMKDAGVDEGLVVAAIREMRTDRILPYRFIAAARYAPNLEPCLEEAMFRCMEGAVQMPGHTVALIDVSGSMDERLSSKSDLTRLDAACGVSMILREICERVTVITFSNSVVSVPPRRGFALKDVILYSQQHSGTYLGKAVAAIYGNIKDIDRLVVITDEQSHDRVPDPPGMAYMINVASNRNGVGYGRWQHVDGFSEAVVDWIIEAEKVRFK